jgi:hypothetical protein
VNAESVRCLGGDGSGYVFASNGGDPSWSPQATLLRVSSTTTTVLYRGTARSIAFGPEVAYLNAGRWGEQISRVDLRSGKLTPVLTGPRYMTRLALRPDGLALATQVAGDDLVQEPGQSNGGSRPAQAVVINLQPSPPRIRATTLGSADQAKTGRPLSGTMVWLNADRVGFFPAYGTSQAVIFDTSLRQLGGIDQWAASTTLRVGDGIIGLGQGTLSVAELPNGPARVLQQFQSPETYALAALPGTTQVLPRAPATQPPPPRAAPAPRTTKPPTTGDATPPIPLLAATAATLALLAGLFLFSRARRRRTPDA